MKLFAIVGETASGKSALAHEFAKKHEGEIICADSRAIYRGMDIGTAKASKQDQADVPYHLLDIKAPNESYNVAQFKQDASSKIAEISSRNHPVIMVGGTGLFVDSVLFDFQFGQSPNDQKRADLQSKTTQELADLASTIDKNLTSSTLSNRRHLIRIIENNNVMNQPKILRKDTVVVGLKIPKSELRKRIEQRAEIMFKKGLRKEVDELAKQYGWECEAMTGIGYREFRSYYEDKTSMSEVKKNIVKNTLHYAKRQRTWFKRNQYINWFKSSQLALKYLESEL